jgi:hypothetical protein
MSNQLPDQSQHRNHPTSTTDREPPTLDHDQPLIDVIGREGTVTTPDGETAVGTTPIGVGSLEPVGQHQDTADPSLGRSPEDAAADRQPATDPRDSSKGSARP